MHIIPKTRLGRYSAWTGIAAYAAIHISYWASMLRIRIPLPGFLAMTIVVVPGMLSLYVIVKHHDRAILLFIASLFGIMGMAFMIAEIIYPH